MLRIPSARRRRTPNKRLNLIPILDSVFIFIFFLLMSANFLKVFEISSDIPIVSNQPPPKSNKKPLALALEIRKNSIVLLAGVPSRTLKSFEKVDSDNYDLEALHQYLLNLKKNHKSERDIIFEPKVDIKYEKLVEIMDAVRLIRKLDEAIYRKTKEGYDEKVDKLFDKIIFGNLTS